MKIDQAVILVAGKGERLEPFTYTKPKPLIQVLDKPFIYYVLENLRAIGISEVVFVVGYLKDKIIAYVKENFSNKFSSIKFVDQGEPLGTGHALKTVRKHVKSRFLLVYGDIYVEVSALRRILEFSEKYENIIAAVETERPWDYGVLIEEGGLLKGIVEKPEPGTEPSNIINAGVYVLSDDIFNYLDKIGTSPRGEIELTDAITLMSKSEKVGIARIDRNKWLELGKLWDILDINRFFLEKVVSQKIFGVVESNVVIKGPALICEEAHVKSGTYIEGPVFIGKGSEIGPNSYIRPYTVIGEYVKIGASCEIKSSVIMNYTHIPHLSYVGDSVIGEHVNFGAGTITANLRFDDASVKVVLKGAKVSSGRRKLGAFIGDYVKTGVDVMFMPGVKVGAYSWISPGLVIYDDVPPKTFVKPKERRGYVFEPLG